MRKAQGGATFWILPRGLVAVFGFAVSPKRQETPRARWRRTDDDHHAVGEHLDFSQAQHSSGLSDWAKRARYRQPERHLLGLNAL